jgi:Domain of unknown function (DUF4136)
MRDVRSRLMAVVIAAGIAVTADTVTVARVKVRVEHDKSFDFKSVRTWGWKPQGRGEVKMARTQEDDPEAMRQRVEPLIVDAVTREMPQRGLQEASGEPDLHLTYYVLLTTSASAQTMGQFLPATTGWGLPPFAPATQSLEIMNRGSLVLDFSTKQAVVWRGLAQADLKMDTDAKKRESVLREAVRDLLRRYPPR